jgi:hypothetical protein
MNAKIIDMLEECFNEEFSLVSHDLSALEDLIKQKMQILGQGLLQRAVDSRPNGYKGTSMVCECGGSMRFAQHRSRDVHTLFGWIKVSRAYYHCSECGKSLFGEGSKETERWVIRHLDLLWEGWTKKLLDSLKEQCRQYRGDKRQAISELIGYISRNEEQMRYDVFRKKGYDIDSGAVEGACKYIVGKRLKKSGMIWSRSGSSSVLALRITWLNKRWEQLWQKKPLAA